MKSGEITEAAFYTTERASARMADMLISIRILMVKQNSCTAGDWTRMTEHRLVEREIYLCERRNGRFSRICSIRLYPTAAI